MSQKARSTFVLTHASEILAALVGLKDVRILRYERFGPDVELMVEQVLGVVRCPTCAEPAQGKERPAVHYIDLPVYGTPMSLTWKKHRMRCVNRSCPKKSWVSSITSGSVSLYVASHAATSCKSCGARFAGRCR